MLGAPDAPSSCWVTNPASQVGTYPLPESQLDRFLMRIRLGYPAAAQEKILLAGEDRRAMVDRQGPVLAQTDLARLQGQVTQVHAAAPVIDYCHELLLFTRRSGRFLHGLSPRAGIGLLRAAKAWALLGDRAYVIPEDIQAVLPSVAVHRLLGADGVARLDPDETATLILSAVPVA